MMEDQPPTWPSLSRLDPDTNLRQVSLMLSRTSLSRYITPGGDFGGIGYRGGMGKLVVEGRKWGREKKKLEIRWADETALLEHNHTVSSPFATRVGIARFFPQLVGLEGKRRLESQVLASRLAILLGGFRRCSPEQQIPMYAKTGIRMGRYGKELEC